LAFDSGAGHGPSCIKSRLALVSYALGRAGMTNPPHHGSFAILYIRA
jgi:hypothetical protein